MRDAGAVCESIALNGGDAFHEGDRSGHTTGAENSGGHICIIENAVHCPEMGISGGYGQFCQIGAAAEDTAVDLGHTCGDGEAGEAGAAAESVGIDLGDTVGKGNFGQAGAAPEQAMFNGGDPLGERNTGQSRAALESRTANIGHAAGNDQFS